ncbi:MAG: capsular polysaccharide biosynthesis protein [Methylobacteriaceae bacterium]|nr:capsular polysaccharide biosynthesis protein [Methylobacteriaceae bacterium]
MEGRKLKRIGPRLPGESDPPATRKRHRSRLASEPTSRRLKLSDRWEPGFLRLPPGFHPRRALSYVVDGLGIYFDATAPSELEILLEEGGWQTAELTARAERGLAELRRRRLSLDNDPRRLPLDEALARAGLPDRGRRVIVVDHPAGDRMTGFGLAGPARFAAMLEAALAENPDADVSVVMDPASPLTRRQGFLADRIAGTRARLVRDPVEAWSLAEGADRLYVVTSHVGFEAAALGRSVTTFGMPFYAGWGFTDDRLTCARRSRTLAASEVFAAAYLVYSRYFEPYDGRACPFEEALEILDLVAQRDRENAAPTLCLGFSPWKRRWVDQTLGSSGNRPKVSQTTRVAPSDVAGASRVVAWASRLPAGTREACAAGAIPLLRMEDGFLRSVGLGVGLRPGASYVLDRTGVYYDATAPCDLETLLEAGGFAPALLARAARLRAAIVAARVSKYNVGGSRLPPLPTGRPVVLVAGQVENDASILLGAVDLGGNLGLLRRVRAANPDATIAYKPHPDVEAGLRPGHIPEAELGRLADVVLRDVAAPDAIEAADRVEVATSLLGFEALMRGKPVVTHGLPFYAGWGLTESPACPRRTRRLTLDELVAGALILYPRYLDPRSGLPCAPEVLVRRLGEGDPTLTRRERTAEAFLKEAWSLTWRHILRRST